MRDTRKTIFITCFFNLSVRNILGTEFFKYLSRDEGLRIVLLVPQGKADLFRKEFGKENVLIEEVKFRKLSFFNLLFHLLSWNLLNTPSKKFHRWMSLKKGEGRTAYFLKSFLAFLGRSRFIIRLFRWLDYILVKKGSYDYLFKKYQPSLVFATDMQDLRVQEMSDTYLVRAARKLGIKSIGMSRSWDSITTKGLLRTLPDVLVVQSETIKGQVIKYHAVASKNIEVIGTPHYDTYLNRSRTSRQDFFSCIGLDPNKKLILLCAPSDMWTGDKELIPALLQVFAELGEQTIVRFPLFGGFDVSDFKKPPSMVYDMPKNVSKLEESFLDLKDDDHLADLIFHSDVVITGPSSIILDAAIFNKPVVLIGFDETKRSLWQNIARYYEYEHQKQTIKEGGFKIAKSKADLINLVQHYLDFPNEGRKEREKVAQSVLDPSNFRQGGVLNEILRKLY